MSHTLEKHNFFVLKKGAPESYYKNIKKGKESWQDLKDKNDLLEPEYLKRIMR